MAYGFVSAPASRGGTCRSGTAPGRGCMTSSGAGSGMASGSGSSPNYRPRPTPGSSSPGISTSVPPHRPPARRRGPAQQATARLEAAPALHHREGQRLHPPRRGLPGAHKELAGIGVHLFYLPPQIAGVEPDRVCMALRQVPGRAGPRLHHRHGISASPSTARSRDGPGQRIRPGPTSEIAQLDEMRSTSISWVASMRPSSRERSQGSSCGVACSSS